jgi:hypothetical protein
MARSECCARRRWMDYLKGCVRWLSIELVNPSPSSSLPRDDDIARQLPRKLLVGERRIANGKYERVTYSKIDSKER